MLRWQLQKYNEHMLLCQKENPRSLLLYDGMYVHRMYMYHMYTCCCHEALYFPRVILDSFFQ